MGIRDERGGGFPGGDLPEGGGGGGGSASSFTFITDPVLAAILSDDELNELLVLFEDVFGGKKKFDEFFAGAADEDGNIVISMDLIDELLGTGLVTDKSRTSFLSGILEGGAGGGGGGGGGHGGGDSLRGSLGALESFLLGLLEGDLGLTAAGLADLNNLAIGQSRTRERDRVTGAEERAASRGLVESGLAEREIRDIEASESTILQNQFTQNQITDLQLALQELGQISAGLLGIGNIDVEQQRLDLNRQLAELEANLLLGGQGAFGLEDLFLPGGSGTDALSGGFQNPLLPAF